MKKEEIVNLLIDDLETDWYGNILNVNGVAEYIAARFEELNTEIERLKKEQSND